MSEIPADLLEAALGNPPFPWQARLLRHFLAGKIPDALDLPTGLGKTSVMAIWLVARACGADLPRRLVYVVDRRAVVDQATSEAEGLRAWARNSEVNRALGLEGRELAVSTLRGQYVDNREWLLDPSAPAIVVGTVDMVGSRLLFEGYGSSRRMRPFFAGLLGQDTLLIIDESHLVPPFECMVRAAFSIGPLRIAGIESPPSRLLPLSATGDSYAKPFQLDADDHAHAIVARRYNAPKSVYIERLRGDLAVALADRAWALASAGAEPRRVLVFTDRRKDADRTRAALEKRIKAERGRGARPTVVLFVGGRRVHERTLAMEELSASGFIAGSQRPDDHAFVIATAAGEVGVDLDADDLVG
ncbi:MAG TPA: type I-U CRISPR-associated helicase/endonuclease Cas3, partial [Nannocystis exedens]|nr:type I-U CRISPR-associated helicase/endonuclease Cas3 [Nannocystis exedens]